MKKIALVLASMLCMTVCFSQIGKSQWEVGGKGSLKFETQDIGSDEYHYNNFRLSPKVGYFICAGFLLGLNLEFETTSYHYNDDDPYKSNSFNTGIFAKYYLGRNGQKHNFFAEGSFDFGGSKPEGQDERFNYNAFSLGIGLACWLNQHIGLNLSFDYRSYNDESQDYYEGENVGRSTSFGFCAGFSMQLDPCKKKAIIAR